MTTQKDDLTGPARMFFEMLKDMDTDKMIEMAADILDDDATDENTLLFIDHIGGSADCDIGSPGAIPVALAKVMLQSAIAARMLIELAHMDDDDFVSHLPHFTDGNVRILPKLIAEALDKAPPPDAFRVNRLKDRARAIESERVKRNLAPFSDVGVITGFNVKMDA